ncbi:HNH endonuclease [Rubrivirga sp.]|uniref:HNH endonuclease n=1 Tax=Rubrivirga sp. TaxID=1885344 RepID=UPI003C7153E1
MCGRRCPSVYRLVAAAFVPNPHGDPSDDRAENLEWVTRAENMRGQARRARPSRAACSAIQLSLV